MRHLKYWFCFFQHKRRVIDFHCRGCLGVCRRGGNISLAKIWFRYLRVVGGGWGCGEAKSLFVCCKTELFAAKTLQLVPFASFRVRARNEMMHRRVAPPRGNCQYPIAITYLKARRAHSSLFCPKSASQYVCNYQFQRGQIYSFSKSIIEEATCVPLVLSRLHTFSNQNIWQIMVLTPGWKLKPNFSKNMSVL